MKKIIIKFEKKKVKQKRNFNKKIFVWNHTKIFLLNFFYESASKKSIMFTFLSRKEIF